MNYRDIKRTTQKQFDETLRKEGFIVTDFFTGQSYYVFFRKVEHNDATTSKLRGYYSQSTPIQKGTLVNFKGSTYVVINQDAIESEVYYTSTFVRCNVPLTISGKSVPFVCNTPNLSTMGSFIKTLGGFLSMFTADTSDARKMRINDNYIIGGRTWKVVNSVYIEGLYYAYLEMTTDVADYSVAWTGAYQYDMNTSTTVANQFVAMNGSAVDPEAVLTYTSSDPTVATIDANGTIHLLHTGTVSFTAVWAAHNKQDTAEITVIDSGGDPSQQFTCTITYNGLSPDVKVGGSFKKYTAKFYDYHGQEASFQSGGVWKVEMRVGSSSFVDVENIVTIERYADNPSVLDANQMRVQVPNTSDTQAFIGGEVRVTYTAPSGVTGSIVGDVLSL